MCVLICTKKIDRQVMHEQIEIYALKNKIYNKYANCSINRYLLFI